MKILTWNCDFKTDSKVYDYIFKEIRPDIALLQEASGLDEHEISNHYDVHWKIIGGKRNWGSAILTKHLNSEPFELLTDPGWVVGTKINPKNNPLYLVSLHARLKDLMSSDNPHGYVIPHLRKIFKELIYLIENNERLIVAGDLNADRLFDEYNYQPPGTEHNNFFDWLEKDLELVNCTKKFNREKIQTIFNPGTKQPYQNDYLFISKNLKSNLKSCHIPERKVVESYSDHSPVIAELDL